MEQVVQLMMHQQQQQSQQMMMIMQTVQAAASVMSTSRPDAVTSSQAVDMGAAQAKMQESLNAMTKVYQRWNKQPFDQVPSPVAPRVHCRSHRRRRACRG